MDEISKSIAGQVSQELTSPPAATSLLSRIDGRVALVAAVVVSALAIGFVVSGRLRISSDRLSSISTRLRSLVPTWLPKLLSGHSKASLPKTSPARPVVAETGTQPFHNETTLVEMTPIGEVPKEFLVVTSDNYAWDARELNERLLSDLARGNPYTKQKFSPSDLDTLRQGARPVTVAVEQSDLEAGLRSKVDQIGSTCYMASRAFCGVAGQNKAMDDGSDCLLELRQQIEGLGEEDRGQVMYWQIDMGREYKVCCLEEVLTRIESDPSELPVRVLAVFFYKLGRALTNHPCPYRETPQQVAKFARQFGIAVD